MDAFTKTDSLIQHVNRVGRVYFTIHVYLLVRVCYVQDNAISLLDGDGTNSCVLFGNAEYTLENGLKACLSAYQYSVEAPTTRYIRNAS